MKQPWELKQLKLAEWTNPRKRTCRFSTTPPRCSVSVHVCVCVGGGRRGWKNEITEFNSISRLQVDIDMFICSPLPFMIHHFRCRCGADFRALALLFCIFMLKGICIWFIVALPSFRQTSHSFLLFLSTMGENNSRNNNNKKKTCRAQTTDITSRSQKDSIVSQFYYRYKTFTQHHIASGDQTQFFFSLPFCVVPDNLAPTVNAHLDHKPHSLLRKFEASLLVK